MKTQVVEINDKVKAEIVRNVSIRIFGSYSNREFDKTFKLDDMAEFDSYNLIYYGRIIGITDKTVTIVERFGRNPRKTRLKLHEFMYRNYNFDLLEVIAKNNTASQGI